MNLRLIYNLIFRPKGIHKFISTIPDGSKLLDVGCGNDSPKRVKDINPNIIYSGIDVADYNQSSANYADEYIITKPEDFSQTIRNLGEKFNFVTSSHNLEHCNDPYKTLVSICSALRSNGKLFLAFPCEDSVNFPSRKVTLNFYDDDTHIDKPIDFEKVLKILKENNFKVTYSKKKYKPTLLYIIGFLQEPFSRLIGKNLQGTWAYYGFETIIWAIKSDRTKS